MAKSLTIIVIIALMVGAKHGIAKSIIRQQCLRVTVVEVTKWLMKTEKDPVFEPKTITDVINIFIGIILFLFFVVSTVLLIISVITIIGFKLGSAIWGDENVIYWISNLF